MRNLDIVRKINLNQANKFSADNKFSAQLRIFHASMNVHQTDANSLQ